MSLPNTAAVRVVSGGRLHALTSEAITELRKLNNGQPKSHFVYIIGGMPDTTTKLRGFKYEECVDLRPSQETIHNLFMSIGQSAHDILENGGIPCFSTVIPMSFHSWNNHRLQQNVTSYLKYEHLCPEMQAKHEGNIIEINKLILERNQEIGVKTPQLATHLLQKRGAGKPYRFRANRLPDGCHADEETIQCWIRDINASITSNRASKEWCP